MKREFLKELLPEISKEAMDAIMAENGKDVEAQKATVTALTTERDGLKKQLDEAGAEIKSYKDLDIEGIKAKTTEWETKYNTDTAALKKQLEDTTYNHAVNGAVSALKFSSESAKKAFVAELTAKKLPLQEGKLLGLDDYTKTYKEADPAAFAPEDDDHTPVITKGGTGGGGPISGDAALRAAFGLPDTTKKE
jgi:hypothetical protein